MGMTGRSGWGLQLEHWTLESLSLISDHYYYVALGYANINIIRKA